MKSPEISRLAAVIADLRDRGYRYPDPIDVEAPVVMTGGDHPANGPDAPLSVDRVREVTPLSIVSGLADAAHAGRAPVLVVDEWGVEDAQAILGSPFLLRARTDGRRQFYSIPDRIALTDGRYACVRTDTNPQWREESATAFETGREDPPIEEGRDRTGTDKPRLLLEADGTVQAALAADALTCPGPEPDAFPYRYGRGADKRIHVFDRHREVGRYAGIAAMKGNAYRPVSLPLLPEHHVKTGGKLARSVTLAVVTADGVEYERP
ncbi:hypothetical protein A6E15_16445 [Natrinema saccharevitans]|uniref:Uncharacterized protein n=1 Tax=Natrinema saccharevitans TaxID=301967 RepID=A0A1S8B1G8_9EURY|nr:hypothetical protein [Natrinema saccharevitans]OLZ42454.1 hypothetical protein A6E15_16445 [Natrinema saccharevitans]